MTKAEIEARLRAAGAYYAGEMDDLHEIWITNSGVSFTVRCAGPFGTVDPEDLAEIEAWVREMNQQPR